MSRKNSFGDTSLGVVILIIVLILIILLAGTSYFFLKVISLSIVSSKPTEHKTSKPSSTTTPT